MKKIIYPLLLIFFVFIFFWQFLIKGLLPVPSDTIVGLYHPYRDFYAKIYPNGIPFKNFLVTDPVRQQYIWKNLTINLEKQFKIPLWNPYSFLGQPLLANFQSAAFYPVNIIFFLINFNYAWSLFIMFQPILACLFMYFYLNNIGLKKQASVLGGIVFAFSGFSIAWLEWGNVVSTGLWLPLILLSIDKIFSDVNLKNFSLKQLIWPILFIFALISSFFAGHLQIYFYVLIVTIFYLAGRFITIRAKNIKIIGIFIILLLISFILILPQLFSTLNFILQSARGIDRNYLLTPGWFLPWQNLVQFLIPDFFGNPATLNYWGIWNYGEFIGYGGIGALMLIPLAIFRKDKKVLFFFGLLIVSLIFALPNIISEIPYKLNILFLSSSQPTRLMFITDFCLAVLASLGFDLLLNLNHKKKILHSIFISSLVFIVVWGSIFIIFKNNIGINFLVVRQNMIFPTILFIINTIFFLALIIIKNKKILSLLTLLFIFILFFDLLRFGLKYLPFTDKNYLYPDTKITKFLKSNTGIYRIMSTDQRIFPSNFSAMYKLQMVDGYDPLFLENYAEFLSAVNRNKPDINPPFGFNRITTFQSYNTSFINLMGVKYILSFDEIKNTNFNKLMNEGAVNLYENRNVFPRAYFVKHLVGATSNQDGIDKLFENKDKLRDVAIIQNIGSNIEKQIYSDGLVQIIRYDENEVILKTKNSGDGFVVLTDTFYPTWSAKIDGKNAVIQKTDYNFRGIFVPSGTHEISFYIKL